MEHKMLALINTRSEVVVYRKSAGQARLKGHVMTYLNRHLDDCTPVNYASCMPHFLRKGEDYWAIFAGTFDSKEMDAARKAHKITSDAVEARHQWYRRLNHQCKGFPSNPEWEGQMKAGTATRDAYELETRLNDQDMENSFGADHRKLFNSGDDHHIATPAQGLDPGSSEVTVEYARTAFLERNAGVDDDAEDEDDDGTGRSRAHVSHPPPRRPVKNLMQLLGHWESVGYARWGFSKLCFFLVGASYIFPLAMIMH
jgi:hypothetical protein